MKAPQYRRWISLFSQTGTEIVEISRYLGRWPDCVITNRELDTEPDINVEILKADLPIYLIPNKPTTETYITTLEDAGASETDTLITLNGYLRIIPKEICGRFNIYNGHPGDIISFPELKGFNPQERAFASKHKMSHVGSVIHRVTPEVDGGEVVARRVCEFDAVTIDDTYSLLHTNSVRLWVEFLENLI